jgi:hypothetical protein
MGNSSDSASSAPAASPHAAAPGASRRGEQGSSMLSRNLRCTSIAFALAAGSAAASAPAEALALQPSATSAAHLTLSHAKGKTSVIHYQLENDSLQSVHVLRWRVRA